MTATAASVTPDRTLPSGPLVVVTVVAAVTEAVVGVLQLTGTDSGAGIHDTRIHVLLTAVAVALLAAAPLWWRLGTVVGARWAGGALGTGNVLLAFGSTASNVNGSDPAFFAPVAVVANVAVLAGLVGLAVAARRRRVLPRTLAGALPVYLLGLVPLSQLGGNLLRGVVLAAVLLALCARAARD